MVFRTETLTVFPAVFLFVMSSFLAFFTFEVADSTAKRGLLALSLSFFIGGLILMSCWVSVYVISKRLQESKSVVISQTRSLSNLVGFFLIATGLYVFAFVGWLTWYDMTTWKKDIALIFFGSRTGEQISLGIGMKVIHYFLMGWSLLLPGLVIFLRRRLRKCPHHFGYLTSHPKETPIPKKCLICPKVADCMRACKCSHHFGYLRSLPNNQAVPQECITCQELLECRNLI